jgi:hypothetical protein
LLCDSERFIHHNDDSSVWKPVGLNDLPKGILSAQMMPPIRAVADIVPLKMTSPQSGVFIFDMGQNLSGWIRLRVRGPAGAAVRMRHAELLYEDGTLNVENLRTARATDTYILRGDPEGEVYEPYFTYHGFRYVELTGFPGTPKLDTVLGREVHSDVKPVGGFSASKSILNQIQRIVLWGTKTNLHSIPTDCDQRNERLGWLADAHLAAETAMLNYDMAAFYTNFLRNIRDSQEPDGAVGDMVPRNGRKGAGDPAWGSAYPILVLYMYRPATLASWKSISTASVPGPIIFGRRARRASFLPASTETGCRLNRRPATWFLPPITFGAWTSLPKPPRCLAGRSKPNAMAHSRAILPGHFMTSSTTRRSATTRPALRPPTRFLSSSGSRPMICAQTSATV